MNRYVVSYQLGQDSGAGGRHERLVSELRQASSEIPWFEGDCLALVTSWLSITDFADWIYFGAGLDAQGDRLLVIDPRKDSAVAIGPFDYPNRLANHFGKCLIGVPDPSGSAHRGHFLWRDSAVRQPDSATGDDTRRSATETSGSAPAMTGEP